ncbi:MAG TPA: hypothetical protein PKC18_18930 [Lacipirellulaceae bacterium]|nr:hypothetical protein [Lacipirellulaceae bacterium]
MAEAHLLFDRAPTTGWVHPEARLYRDLCAEWQSMDQLSEPLKTMLWNCFDTVRSPNYRPDFFVRLTELRLEFGAIMWKYVLANKGEINWQEVVELVSR